MTAIEETIAERVSRAVTRRTLLQRTMRWTLGVGAAAATTWRFTDAAYAAGCGAPGQIGTWGCYCSGTPGCGSGKCCFDTANACCGGAVPRCDYWTLQPYCWCSLTCCIGSSKGYYSCCDCWPIGGAPCSQSNGRTACMCGHRHITGSC